MTKEEAGEVGFCSPMIPLEEGIEMLIAEGATQQEIAEIYATGIQQRNRTKIDWGRINAAIFGRWPMGLTRIKEMAWKIAEARVR